MHRRGSKGLQVLQQDRFADPFFGGARFPPILGAFKLQGPDGRDQDDCLPGFRFLDSLTGSLTHTEDNPHGGIRPFYQKSTCKSLCGLNCFPFGKFASKMSQFKRGIWRRLILARAFRRKTGFAMCASVPVLATNSRVGTSEHLCSKVGRFLIS